MMQTSPPTKRNFNSLVNQWVIYDRYMAYEAAKERAEENEAKMDGTLVSSHVRKRLTKYCDFSSFSKLSGREAKN